MTWSVHMDVYTAMRIRSLLRPFGDVTQLHSHENVTIHHHSTNPPDIPTEDQ